MKASSNLTHCEMCVLLTGDVLPYPKGVLVAEIALIIVFAGLEAIRMFFGEHKLLVYQLLLFATNFNLFDYLTKISCILHYDLHTKHYAINESQVWWATKLALQQNIQICYCILFIVNEFIETLHR